MSAADQIRALADRLAENRGDYERTAFPEPRDGTCDACSESTALVAKWPTYDGNEEPWLCGPCDSLAQDEQAAVNALPKVADLVEATRTHVVYTYASRTMRPDIQTPYCRQCGQAWPCAIATARDALTAALGVAE